MAELDFNIDTDPIKRATAELAKMAGSAEKVGSAVSKLESRSAKTAAALDRIHTTSTKVETSLRGANGQFIKASDNFNKNAAEIHKLRLRYDEAYASSVRYAQEVSQLNTALTQGAISPEIYGQQLLSLDQAFGKAGNQAGQFGKQMRGAGANTANVFAQLNDIGVMLAAGQNPIQLALQQGTQLNQVWGTMGGNFKAVGSTIVSAFTSMLSPINLVTLGVIAGAGALTQWAMSARGSSKDAKTSIDNLRASISAYNDAAKASKMSTAELAKTYGYLSASARTALENIEAAKYADSVKQVGESISSVMNGSIRDLTNVAPYMKGLTDTTHDLDFAFKLNGESAKAVLQSLQALEKAKGLEAQGTAAAALSKEMLAAYGNIEKMPPKAREVFDQVQQIVLSTAEVTSQTNSWSGAMASVLSYTNAIGQALAGISGGAINVAAARVERAALEAGRSTQDAALAASRERANLESVEIVKGLGIQNKLIEKGAIIALQAAKQLEISEIESTSRLRERIADQEREAAKSTKAKGGGGAKAAARKAAAELKAAEKGFQNIRELMEKESIFQFAEYEKRQKQLDAAIGKRLLSEQNYQLMSQQLRVLYFGADYERNALQYQMDLDQLKQHHANKLLSDQEYYRARKDLFWSNLLNEDNRSAQATDLSNTAQYFGQLHSLTGSSYDGLQRLQQSFQAASAVMNAWKGYTDALAQGGLSPWAKLAWGGKILAAGLGAAKAIKGGGKSGGSKPSTSSPSTPAGSSVGSVSHDVNLTLVGDTYDKKTVVQMVEELNKAFSDGSKINVRAV